MAVGMAKSFEKNKYLAALGACLLFSVYSPLAIAGAIPVDQMSSLITIIAFTMLFIGAKKFSHVAPLLIVYLLIYGLTSTHFPGSLIILALTVASLVANELILNGKNIWKLLTFYAFAPVSLAFAFFFSGSPVALIASVIPYILATALFIGIRKKKNRKSVIIALTFVFALIAATCVLIYMLISGKDFFGVREAYASARDGFADYMFSYGVELDGEIVPLFTDVPLAKEIFISMSNSLPAIIIITFIVLSYFLYNYQTSMLEKLGAFEYITQDILDIKISAAAAATYLIAFIFSTTTDSYGGEPFGSVVCKNLYTILTPALAYSGLKSVRSFIQKKKIRVGFLLILPLVLLAMTGYIFMILSLVGVICIFVSSAREWAEKKD